MHGGGFARLAGVEPAADADEEEPNGRPAAEAMATLPAAEAREKRRAARAAEAEERLRANLAHHLREDV